MVSDSNLRPRLTLPLLLAACLQSIVGAHASAVMQMGSSEVDITPPIGYRMGGGFTEVLSTGVEDPLYAKAMVLQQGDTHVALVVCDLTSLSKPVSDPVRQKAAALTGIPFENITIAASHTHGGPSFDGTLFEMFKANTTRQNGGKDPHEPWEYKPFLIGKIVEAIQLAYDAKRPVATVSGKSQLPGFSHNRRFLMRDGSVLFNPKQNDPAIIRPVGPIDETLSVLGFLDPETGNPIGSLTTFDMHVATTGRIKKFSADFPGVLQRQLEQVFGEGYFSLFGQGTAGDTNHVPFQTDRPRPTAEQIGSAMAEKVASLLPTLASDPPPSLAMRSKTVGLDLLEVTPSQIERAKALLRREIVLQPGFYVLVNAYRDLNTKALRDRDGSSLQAEVQAIRVNEKTAIVTLPHEIFIELGGAIEEGSPFENTFVISLANDDEFYIATEKAYAEGSYEIDTSSVKPGSGERLVTTALQLLKELSQ